MPGSNPMFGLNTLGGALSVADQGRPQRSGHDDPAERRQLRTQDGRVRTWRLEFQGAELVCRRQPVLRGRMARRFALGCPAVFRQTWLASAQDDLTGTHARLRQQLADRQRPAGTALARPRLCERLYHSRSHRQSLSVSQPQRAAQLPAARSRSPATPTTATSAPRTLNGDINEDSLDQSVYQPSAADHPGTDGGRLHGIPYQRRDCRQHSVSVLALHRASACRGTSRARSAMVFSIEPAPKQHNYGVSGQMTWFGSPHGKHNQFTVGAATTAAVVELRAVLAARLSQSGPQQSPA